MANDGNREHKIHCAKLRTRELKELIEKLDPQVNAAMSLLTCAKQELKRRDGKWKKPTRSTS